MTNNTRPVFLNPLLIALPIAGVLSIAHRMTGILLVLSLPALIWLLGYSLSGAEGFNGSRDLLHGPIGSGGLFLLLWALLHHLLAGIRYLLIDAGIGIERPVYRISALLVLISAPILANYLVGKLV
ncbi:MAG: succinate dehydrogenase, cytochrome b556 subunit [Gammaproteobacteria bacterium]|nr:succinate dehydrogenase, cytochrome b556 subunit [Gammaproteobacteria bacterium]MBU1654517.1 succinate dehydrogenase, cytochrome b556 subunit [Gammaproteobacteria bacterium]MBU1962674.1 succinate dehydrogenase, cytochrome b556 subunit [Gammaproteobacteria bacterium]